VLVILRVWAKEGTSKHRSNEIGKTERKSHKRFLGLVSYICIYLVKKYRTSLWWFRLPGSASNQGRRGREGAGILGKMDRTGRVCREGIASLCGNRSAERDCNGRRGPGGRLRRAMISVRTWRVLTAESVSLAWADLQSQREARVAWALQIGSR
jgi:hypothetical protein